MSVFWIWLLSAFVASLIGTGLARRYALRRQMLDMPGDARRNHREVTPRGGGIAFALVLCAFLLHAASVSNPAWGWVAAGLFLVAGIGFCDDHKPLSAGLRLGVHALAALFLFFAGLAFAWPLWLCLCAALAALALTNIWNFIDGIDGIAASQALLVALAALCLTMPSPILFAAVLAGGMFGFLPWNFPRARIFMGDVGSGALGYALAVLWAQLAAQSSASAWLLALPLSACLLDAGLTLARRILAGEKWWQAHSSHLYQLASRRLRRHWPVTLAYAGWTLTGIMFALCFADRPWPGHFFLCLAWYGLGALLWFCLRRTDSGDPE